MGIVTAAVFFNCTAFFLRLFVMPVASVFKELTFTVPNVTYACVFTVD
jgi:hypothetical protein